MTSEQEKAVTALLHCTNYGNIVSGYYSAIVGRWYYTMLHSIHWRDMPLFAEVNSDNLLHNIHLVAIRGTELYSSTVIESMLDKRQGEQQSLFSLYRLCRELEEKNNRKHLQSLHAGGSVDSLKAKIERLRTSDDWNTFKNLICNPAAHWREERFIKNEIYNSEEVQQALDSLLNTELPKMLNFVSKKIFRQSGKLPTAYEYIDSVVKGRDPGVWLFEEKWYQSNHPTD